MMQMRQIMRYQAVFMVVTLTMATRYLTVLFVIGFICIRYPGILVITFNYVITGLQKLRNNFLSY